MNTEVKKKWIEALREGFYLQTKRQLRDKDKDDYTCFCAYGVLVDLYCKEHNVSWEEVQARETLAPATLVREWAGFDVGISLPVPDRLLDDGRDLDRLYPIYDLNDNCGVTFTEFADLLEEHE